MVFITNYVAIVVEAAVIPLTFSCYITAAIFSLVKLILLRRISIEKDALKGTSTH